MAMAMELAEIVISVFYREKLEWNEGDGDKGSIGILKLKCQII